MPIADVQSHTYDLIVVGTGFAGSFFLERYLERAPENARVLVLERGALVEPAAKLAARQVDTLAQSEPYVSYSGHPDKRWVFNISFGGGTNCWWGNAPRFLPADFEMRTRFDVGDDWPIGYDELEPYYDRAEAIMALAGAPGPAPYRRAADYRQPPHLLTDPEKLLKKAYPRQFFHMPTARARTADAGRGVCCANAVCHLCPVNAKFNVQNGLMRVYDDPRVSLSLGVEVTAVDHADGRAKAVLFSRQGRDGRAAGNLIALCANAVFNPIILERSGLDHPMLGRRLHEQVGLRAEAYLDGVESFQGSTSVTGVGYMLYDDEARRREKAAAMLETWNYGSLRREFGKWRQVMPIRLVYDVLPDARNRVRHDAANPGKALMHWVGHGDYTQKAVDSAQADLERVLAPLPIEGIRVERKIEATESHIIGTTVMGNDPASSVIDKDCIHHRLRNLLVLGSSTFPTGTPSNPSLTIAAQALRSADRVMA